MSDAPQSRAPAPAPRRDAAADFRRSMKWIVLIAVVMVAGTLVLEASMGPLYIHMVVATVLGVFISMVLGCGLFALAFFSDKSGHDDVVAKTTERREEPQDRP